MDIRDKYVIPTNIRSIGFGFTTMGFSCSVKLLDWGEEGHRTEAEIAALRAAFSQEVAVWHKLDHPNVTKVTFFLKILVKSIMEYYVLGVGLHFDPFT